MAKQTEENNSSFENPEAIVEGYSKFETWAAKNKTKIGLGVAVLILGVGAFIWFSMSSSEAERKSQEKIYAAEYYFGLDSLDLALEGNGLDVIGFRQIASKYSGTKAGNLAQFYIGTIELQKGNFDAAIKALNEFSADDYIVQGRAYEMLGDCYAELQQYDKAIEQYRKAVEYNPNKEFTPLRMIKLARVYEVQGKYADAKLEYDNLLKEYPQSPFREEALKYRALAEGKSGKG